MSCLVLSCHVCLHHDVQACDLSSLFNLFGLLGTGTDTTAQDRSLPGGDDNRSTRKNNKFETIKRSGNPSTSSTSSSSSSSNNSGISAVRADTFKNIKLTPELEATRRRVEDELTVKMEKQSDIQEQRERNARSPMLTSIGNMFGFGGNGGRDGGLSSAALGSGGGGGSSSLGAGGGSVFGMGSQSQLTPRSASAGRYSAARPDSRGSVFSGFHSEKAPSVSSNRSLVSAGGERGVQDAFERVLGTDGLDVTVYLTSREGDTKSKRAIIKRDKNASTVYVEIKSRPKRPGEKEAAKRLKFDLANDVMMVAKGKGSGRGPNDAKVPRTVDDNCVLHFILKGKPELNVEVDGGADSRDAVLTGFMQLISRHRSAALSGRNGGGGGGGGS